MHRINTESLMTSKYLRQWNRASWVYSYSCICKTVDHFVKSQLSPPPLLILIGAFVFPTHSREDLICHNIAELGWRYREMQDALTSYSVFLNSDQRPSPWVGTWWCSEDLLLLLLGLCGVFDHRRFWEQTGKLWRVNKGGVKKSYDGIVQCAVVRVFAELRLHHTPHPKVDSFSFDPQNYTQNTTERQRGKSFWNV